MYQAPPTSVKKMPNPLVDVMVRSKITTASRIDSTCFTYTYMYTSEMNDEQVGPVRRGGREGGVEAEAEAGVRRRRQIDDPSMSHGSTSIFHRSHHSPSSLPTHPTPDTLRRTLAATVMVSADVFLLAVKLTTFRKKAMAPLARSASAPLPVSCVST